MPRASIIIPTHDNDSTLALAVRSALGQSVTEIEVIICGDGATDRVRDVARTLAASDDRVVFLDLPKGPHRGEVRRHEAILNARSDAILYLCDDDLLLPAHVADLLELLVDHDFVQSLCGRVDPDGGIELYPGVLGDPETIEWILREDRRFNSVSLTGTGHSRSRYIEIGMHWETTPEGMWPDHHQWRRMLGTGVMRSATSSRMTALQFPSGEHGRSDWDERRRFDEVTRWAEFVTRSDAQDKIDRLVFDGVTRQIGSIYRQTLDLHVELREANDARHGLGMEVGRLRQEIDSLRIRLSDAHQENAALRATVSWRLTAPLRLARRAISRARARVRSTQ